MVKVYVDSIRPAAGGAPPMPVLTMQGKPLHLVKSDKTAADMNMTGSEWTEATIVSVTPSKLMIRPSGRSFRGEIRKEHIPFPLLDALRNRTREELKERGEEYESVTHDLVDLFQSGDVVRARRTTAPSPYNQTVSFTMLTPLREELLHEKTRSYTLGKKAQDRTLHDVMVRDLGNGSFTMSGIEYPRTREVLSLIDHEERVTEYSAEDYLLWWKGKTYARKTTALRNQTAEEMAPWAGYLSEHPEVLRRMSVRRIKDLIKARLAAIKQRRVDKVKSRENRLATHLLVPLTVDAVGYGFEEYPNFAQLGYQIDPEDLPPEFRNNSFFEERDRVVKKMQDTVRRGEAADREEVFEAFRKAGYSAALRPKPRSFAVVAAEKLKNRPPGAKDEKKKKKVVRDKKKKKVVDPDQMITGVFAGKTGFSKMQEEQKQRVLKQQQRFIDKMSLKKRVYPPLEYTRKAPNTTDTTTSSIPKSENSN